MPKVITPNFSLLTNKETNDFYNAGETIRQPMLATFLYGLANASDPIQYFYNSSITDKMADEFKKNGTHNQG